MGYVPNSGGDIGWCLGLSVVSSSKGAGGIHGVIKEINDNDVVLEIASNVKIRIDKNSIFAAAADANSSQASK
jgi:hypothetical protein